MLRLAVAMVSSRLIYPTRFHFVPLMYFYDFKFSEIVAILNLSVVLRILENSNDVPHGRLLRDSEFAIKFRVFDEVFVTDTFRFLRRSEF